MSVDLTLPESSSPAIDPYKDVSDPLLPFGLYVHVDLPSEDDLSSIEELCNSQVDGSAVVRRALRCDMSGQPLRAALDDHLANLSTRRFDPFYFVAVVDENWREAGVILVTMDDGSDEDVAHIDKLRVPVRDAGLVLVNLQIANVDWEEYKEEYEDDQEGDDDNDDNDDNENQQKGKEEESAPRDSNLEEAKVDKQTDETFSDGASTTLPNIGYWIGLYSIPSIPYETVMRELHPSWGPPVPYSDLICRPEGRVPTTQEAAVSEAARLHPMRCKNNPHLCRDMFFIIDTPNYSEEGILLVKLLDWDEAAADDNKAKSHTELSELGKAAHTDTQRLPFANATTLTLFNEIKAGHRPWKHPHRTFLAYAGPRVQYPSAYLSAADKAFKRRKSGSERFAEKNVQFPLDGRGNVIQDKETAFGAVLDQHWTFVREERFRDTLCADYFVFCDRELSSKDVGARVSLVRIDREGDWSAMSCAAGEAYGVLCDLADGKGEWKGTKVIPAD